MLSFGTRVRGSDLDSRLLELFNVQLHTKRYYQLSRHKYSNKLLRVVTVTLLMSCHSVTILSIIKTGNRLYQALKGVVLKCSTYKCVVTSTNRDKYELYQLTKSSFLNLFPVILTTSAIACYRDSNYWLVSSFHGYFWAPLNAHKKFAGILIPYYQKFWRQEMKARDIKTTVHILQRRLPI